MFEKDGVIFFDRIDLNGNLIQTAEEAYNAWANREQIDNCLDQTKTNEQLTQENEQLWETVEFLLKNVDLIPKEIL